MKNENYKQPIFIDEIINKSTVSSLFDLLIELDVYKKSFLSTNYKANNEIRNYGIMIDNYHFEGDEKESKIFLIGLLLKQKQIRTLTNF